MSKVHMLRAFVNQRLTLAAEEIFELFERTIVENEKEICRQGKLLNAVFNPEVRLHRADVQQLMVNREAVPPEQQIWSPSLDQQNPPELPNIKEEQQELWTKQKEEQLQLLEEADITKFTFTPVKSEEEKPQTSLLHQSQTEELRDAEHLKTDADEEHSGRSEPASNLNPDNHLETSTNDKTSHFSEPKTDDSCDWEQMKDSESSLKPLQNKKALLSDKEINTGEASVSYSECATRFGHKRYLRKRKHNKTQTGVSTISCSVCRKTFPRKQSLKIHMRLHTGETPFSCPFCGKKFHQRSAQISHMRVHTGEKPFECTSCAVRFSHSTTLARHIKNHGKKSFSCSICEKKFGRKENLHFHMKTHTKDMPFYCTVCYSGFTDSESLVKHMIIHTGQTPFSCSVCGQKFAWRRYLTKHMEVHAKGDIFRCNVCDGEFAQIDQLRNHQCFDESSQLCESQAEENREAELLTSSSYEQMKTEADGEDTRGPEPVRNSDPERHFQPDMENSADSDFWQENREPRSRFGSQEHNKVSQSDTTCNAGGKQLNCSESDETFSNNHHLKIHKINYTQEKQLNSSTCKNPYEKSMEVHAGLHRGAERNPEPPHIKEEQEELWSSQDGEQLHRLEEADISKFTFTPVPVKSQDNDGDDDEEKPQTSKHHQTQTEQIKTEADGEDCGGPEPGRNSDPERHFQPDTNDSVDSDFWKETRERSTGLSSLKNAEITESFVGLDSGNKVLSCSEDKAPKSLEPDNDDSVDSDFWKETRERSTGLSSLKNAEITESFVGLDSGNKVVSCSEDKAPESLEPDNDDSSNSDFRKDDSKPQQTGRDLHSFMKPYRCSDCDKRFSHIYHLKRHKKFHLREKFPFVCSVCGHRFLYKFPLEVHMRTHTGEKPFGCPLCGKKYGHKATLQSHMITHTASKKYPCNACYKSFAWYTELKYHRCVGESSNETPPEEKNM